jgi:N-acylneuraminate cytidylyltransferase/CMP-N,N'-diacetyllegionaminic acid synthase
MASDSAPKVPAIRHCAESAEKSTGIHFNVIVDLDATAPLRIVDDIVGAVRLLETSDFANIVSGAPARRSPYFNLVERDDTGRVHLSKPPKDNIFRRQDSPDCFDLNASIFVWTRDMLYSDVPTPLGDNTGIFVMPEERSIDIDTETDFEFVEFMLNKRGSAA